MHFANAPTTFRDHCSLVTCLSFTHSHYIPHPHPLQSNCFTTSDNVIKGTAEQKPWRGFIPSKARNPWPTIFIFNLSLSFSRCLSTLSLSLHVVPCNCNLVLETAVTCEKKFWHVLVIRCKSTSFSIKCALQREKQLLVPIGLYQQDN